MICDCEISVQCKNYNQSPKALCHGIKVWLDMFLGNFPSSSLYANPQSIKSSSCWRTMMNKLLTNHIADLFDGWHVQVREAVISIALQRRLAQSLWHVSRYCPAQICNVELLEGRTVSWALKAPLYVVVTFRLSWIHRRWDHILYPTEHQTIALDVCQPDSSTVQALRLHPPQ